MSPRVKIHRLHPEATLPRYMSVDAAGLDLTAAIDAPIVIEPGRRAPIATGLAMEIERGYEGQLRPRSGLARDHGITLANSPATIDADYRGHVVVVLANLGDHPVTIKPKDRICQLVIAPALQAEIVEVADASELTSTDRGAGGFGSTGKA
ncbi:MAG: dUTP diphosphatase [Proteobacteria bacterium]|nr:dUTP diphosphatase [Pseudomonadota bacterium]